MANVLDVDAPEYKIEEVRATQFEVKIVKESRQFEDDMQQKFYRDLPDFKRFTHDASVQVEQFSEHQLSQ